MLWVTLLKAVQPKCKDNPKKTSTNLLLASNRACMEKSSASSPACQALPACKQAQCHPRPPRKQVQHGTSRDVSQHAVFFFRKPVHPPCTIEEVHCPPYVWYVYCTSSEKQNKSDGSRASRRSVGLTFQKKRECRWREQKPCSFGWNSLHPAWLQGYGNIISISASLQKLWLGSSHAAFREAWALNYSGRLQAWDWG